MERRKRISRLIVPVCIIIVFIQTSFARAQTQDPSYSLSTGFAIPSAPDDFAESWNSGYNLGASIGYPLSPNLTFQGCLDYNSFTLDEDGFLGGGLFSRSANGGTTSIVTASANLKAILSSQGSSVSPYFTGGLGFFRLSFGDVTVTDHEYPGGFSQTVDGDSETAISIFFGAGLEFAINEKVNFFAEGKYGIGFTEDESTRYFPVKLGFSFK